MDHYCPFVLCTIGFQNHGMFALLCLYNTLGIAIGLFGFCFWLYMDYLATMRDISLLWRLIVSGLLLVDAALVLSLGSFTSYMLFYNIKFVSENMTTIDWYDE